MGIIGRIEDVMAAHVHDMLDRLESPERMLKQAVREMQEDLSAQQGKLARVMAEGTLTLQLQAEHERQIARWTKYAVSCLRSEDEALARKAILQRRSLQARAAELKSHQEDAERLRQHLAGQLSHMQETVREARRKLGTLSVHKRAAELQTRLTHINRRFAVTSELDGRLDRLRRKVERTEAEAQALEELASATRQEN